MLNDSDDKFEGQDESEYHFSDDEVSYELEEETSPKASDVPSESGASTKKESFISQFTQSKRMMVSVGVFLVLVVVVYKMVSPTSTSAPSTDIVSAPTPTAAPGQAPSLAGQQPAQNLQTTPAQQPAQVAAQAVAPATQSMAAVAPQSQQVVVQPAQPVAPQQQAQASLPPLPAGIPSSAQPAAAQAMAAAQSMVQSVVGALPTNQAASAAGQPVATMPSVIPVPTPTTASTADQGSAASTGYMVPGAGTNTDEKVAAIAANNERLMGQLQGQYTQQYNDFSNQTRAVQDQMQTLNARVSVIENQLNQLIQALTKRNAGNTSLNSPPPTRLVQPERQTLEGRIAYNVQAIIPGRAWLKSDNGETVTVAEGDAIKGVGRVTKIDPYDGIVEINTGNKSISLSYGDSA